MAVDQNSAPMDLDPLTPNRNPANAIPPTEDATDDQSSRTVKLLCSFGGKILPRLSDGALRYAGGQTRILAFRRDTTLHELYRKMDDVFGGRVVIRYQLPDQDLDALVSVSSAEDLDNMMDEYDKLSEAYGDGSTKLRVFLFSSSATESSLAGFTVADSYDSGQSYIEAVNGVAASESGASRIHWKDSTASATSTQNSDAGGDGFIYEGMSPIILSPVAAASASLDPSGIVFVGNDTSVLEHQRFAGHSTVVDATNVAAQTVNPPPVGPYASQAYVEPHQVQNITPYSFAMASAPQLVNVVTLPQHPYLPPLHIPHSSVPLHIGNLKQLQGKVDSYFEESQYGGQIVQLISDQNYKVLQQPITQIPPLHPSQMQFQGIERYGLHSVQPLPKGQGLRLEDCQMCQRAPPHAHSDELINEQDKLSGFCTLEAHPALQSHYSEDIRSPQVQHRVFNVAMRENVVKPEVESYITRGHYGAYGVNLIPELILEKEKLVVPNAESFDPSREKQILGQVSLTGDTQISYGALVNPPQLHHESSLQKQQQVLHREHFDHAIVHLPVTIGLSSTALASYGVTLSPPLPHHEDYLQQQKVLQAENFDHAKVSQLPCTMAMTGNVQTSYGVSLSPTQLHHEDSLLLQQQQWPQTTPTLYFSVEQNVIGKKLGQVSNSMENTNYQAPDHVSNSVLGFSYDYAKPVNGMMEALCVSTVEKLRVHEQLKPAIVPNLNVSNDMKPEKSCGEQNHAIRPQGGANLILPTSAFVSSGFVSKGVSAEPVNPLFSNIAISKDMKPETPSVVGEENTEERLHNAGNALLSSNDFVIPEVLPGASSPKPVNPLQSATVNYMNLHNLQYANTTQLPTFVANHGPFSQNVEEIVDLAGPPDVMLRMIPYHMDSDYMGVINKSPDGEWQDAKSEVNPMDLHNGMTSLPGGNMPFQVSCSNHTPGLVEKFLQTSASDSFFCNQDPWKILGCIPMCPPNPTTMASRESPVPKDMFIENFLSHSPDIAVLLGEGALQNTVDSLNKDSRPGHFRAAQGTDNAKQDLCDLAERVGESVLQSSVMSVPALFSLEPNESSPTFYNATVISEDNSSSHSAAVLGDQKIADIKVKQSDKLHFGITDDIRHLQIIKNCDLEELRELGSGTFGTVYHGKWKGSDVAIKRINDRCFDGKPSEQERMRSDFWNEAYKLADLHHPNVVAFYGIVLDGPGGSFATVTEYMVNGSLRNVLQSNDKSLDQRKRLLIAMDAAFGMEYLHGKNIVHFDLKSDNLLVNLRDNQRPICKVGDLGLSKVKCKTLISGGVRGTLPWMAPELLNGSSNLVSEKVDVFSFGIVMWELLTGQEPYADLHYGAIIGGIVNNTLRPSVPESCGPEWRTLMEQCWSTEPSERPCFTEIADRLRSITASLSQKNQAPSAQPQP